MSEEDYVAAVKERLGKMGIDVIAPSPEGITAETLQNVGGVFVGGGHTYTLLHKLQQTGGLEAIREAVENGLPYMGSSAGTVIASPTIKTTNDMPGPANDVIDLKSMGLVDIQINPHYMDDAMHDPAHQGETRDTRLQEVCKFNPGKAILGLYEGQAVRVRGDKTEILTSKNNRGTKPPIFLNDKRTEIDCNVGEPKDVSRIFKAPEPHTRQR
jgi:dipeptidase E